jgi:hypothetical protein
MYGKLLFSFSTGNEATLHISLSGIARGIYLLEIENNNKQTGRRKLIKN